MEDKNEIKTDEVKNKAQLDFITSVVLLVVCVCAIIASIGYWRGVGGKFFASPGFMPIIISGALSLMAVMLMVSSLKDSSVKERVRQLCASFIATVRSRNVHRAAVGIAMFAVYVFAMLGRMPFWLASFITLFALLMFLLFDKKLKTAIKLLLVSSLSVAGIILLFQVAFSVPMP